MKTVSLCNVCYRKVPAVIVFTPAGVEMHKFCSEHGVQRGLVERDVSFFQGGDFAPDKIYEGHLVDITGACNLQCQYCYRPRGGHKSMYDIVTQLTVPGPYFLIGGEPTIHPDFIKICDEVSTYGETGVTTNFVRFMDKHEILKAFRRLSPRVSAASYHPNSGLSITDITMQLEKVDIKFDSLLIVVDSLSQFPELIREILESPKNRFQSYRFKLASKVWNTKEDCGLFVSDAFKWFKENMPELKFNPRYRYDFLEMFSCDRIFALVKWPTVDNVNLQYQACCPTTTAEDGSVNNVLVSYILNGKGSHV